MKKEYFEGIPFDVRDSIVTDFLFKDILERPAFKLFIQGGAMHDPAFVYEVSFGFLPRQFEATQQDRYFIEEESDVTEIYFVIKGSWAVAFNIYVQADLVEEEKSALSSEDSGLPEDMRKAGQVIAKKFKDYGYFGDYYVLSSKRSQFHYVALSHVEAYALPKRFVFNVLLKKFPGLHQVLLADAFHRY